MVDRRDRIRHRRQFVARGKYRPRSYRVRILESLELVPSDGRRRYRRHLGRDHPSRYRPHGLWTPSNIRIPRTAIPNHWHPGRHSRHPELVGASDVEQFIHADELQQHLDFPWRGRRGRRVAAPWTTHPSIQHTSQRRRYRRGDALATRRRSNSVLLTSAAARAHRRRVGLSWRCR